MTGANCAFLFALLSFADARLSEPSAFTCPPKNFSSVQNFNIEAFVKARWFIHQQQPTSYLPKTQNRCVYAEYTLKPKKSFWGYDIGVHNVATDVAAPHAVHDSKQKICAKIYDKSAGKLGVAPCFLPTEFSGDYWVIDWSDEEGYALISGGAPTHVAAGGCRTGTGVNGAGLWIFTRQQKRDSALVDKVRGIATGKGFDLGALNDVDQTNCGAQALVI